MQDPESVGLRCIPNKEKGGGKKMTTGAIKVDYGIEWST